VVEPVGLKAAVAGVLSSALSRYGDLGSAVQRVNTKGDQDA